jgi:hypothetical protein
MRSCPAAIRTACEARCWERTGIRGSYKMKGGGARAAVGVLGGVHEFAVGTVDSVDAVTGAAIGRYRESRLRS